VSAHRKLAGAVRHHVGAAAHRAGAATRSDVRKLGAGLQSLRAEVGPLPGELALLRGELASLSSRLAALERQRPPAQMFAVDVATSHPGTRVAARPLTRTPSVSVVIPCHNYARFLAAAVGTVTAQTGVEVDVLILDDGSTDETRELAQSLAAQDPRVRCIVHERNVGHIATFNEGVAAAQGDYVVLLSADDLLAPGSLARATALLDSHPSVAFAYGTVVPFQGESPPARVAREADMGWTIWTGHNWIKERCRLGANAARSPEVVMRTSVQRQIGGYRAELPHTADMEMWLRAAGAGDVGRVEGSDQAFHREHPDSLSHKLCITPTDDLRARHDAFVSVLGRSAEVAGAEHLYGQARYALAVTALNHARERYDALAADELAELEAFALEMFPGATDTVQWLAVELRRSAAEIGHAE
jgi:hypothetical protein